MSSLTSKIALKLYELSVKSGFLKSSFGQKVFSWSYFQFKKYFEDPFAALIRKHPNLFMNGHILDIGANIGYTTYLFAKAVDKNFKVFAFEPELGNFTLLEKNIKSYNLTTKVIAEQFAVGRSEGVVHLEKNAFHHVWF